MKQQNHLFNLDNSITYLNGAYMSPQLKTVEEIGHACLEKKNKPYRISETDFFTEKVILKQRFAALIEVDDHETIAIIPSVSYGVSTVLRNIDFQKGDEIIVLEEQFPSNYYAWQELEKEKGVVIVTVEAPPIAEHRGALWNQKVLEAISVKTKCVALPQVHWADGTLFDLKKIRKRTLDVEAYLIIDGTQSVGVMPFSVKEIQPDALICGGYKWLMGPYSLGVAYFGERFHEGTPIENNWMNHAGSENFSNLVNYNPTFKDKATRYDVGESSNFILTPMLSEGIRQLIEWNAAHMQDYCEDITKKPLKALQEGGYFIEDAQYRGHHLFGIYVPKGKDIQQLKEKLLAAHIHVSYRGAAVRVSPNVYNSKKQLEKLVSCFLS